MNFLFGVILLMVFGTVPSPIAAPYVPPSKSHDGDKHTLWESIDLQIFCDSVDLVLLIKACSVLEYPRIPLLLLVQAFSGLRTLRADGHHSEQILVSNGLVAGSSQVNHLARALLHRALHDHHHRCPKLGVSQFVDDLKMHTEGTIRQVVYRFSQPAVEMFHSLGKLKVDLSP